MPFPRQQNLPRVARTSSYWVALLAIAALPRCSTTLSTPDGQTGGAATGGSATGNTGGSVTTGGNTPTGGTVSTGGTPSTGGNATTGGTMTGGASAGTGGNTTGGLSSGGSSGASGNAGAGTSGSSTGGASASASAGAAGGSAGGKSGTGGAAGASTAGSAGSGTAGSTGSLCPANALFCEDFEDGNLDGWTNSPSGGTLAITSMMPSHGTKSLQIDVPAQQYGGALIRNGAPLFPLPNKRFWGRLMVYFDSIADGHTDIIRGAPTGGGTPQYNVGEQHGEILLNYYAGSESDCWARPKPSKVVPLKTWMCWEWSFDGALNQMQFYIDGALSRQVDVTGDGCLSNPTQPWTAPTFGELRIGEYVAERSPNAQRIWIDDIAVSTEGRVACPTP